MRGEAPFVSHLLYTQVLEDNLPEDRELGMQMALLWATKAEFTAVYKDFGISAGMERGIEHAKSYHRDIMYRNLIK